MLQEILLVLSTLIAVAYLVIRFKPTKKVSGCGDSCGCESKKVIRANASS